MGDPAPRSSSLEGDTDSPSGRSQHTGRASNPATLLKWAAFAARGGPWRYAIAMRASIIAGGRFAEHDTSAGFGQVFPWHRDRVSTIVDGGRADHREECCEDRVRACRWAQDVLRDSR